MDSLTQMKEYLSSEEGKKSIESFLKDLNDKKDKEKSIIDNIHQYKKDNNLSFEELYLSEKFDTEYLLKYSSLYGREAIENEFIHYGNQFTGEMYKIENYYVSAMYGQGEQHISFDKDDGTNFDNFVLLNELTKYLNENPTLTLEQCIKDLKIC